MHVVTDAVPAVIKCLASNVDISEVLQAKGFESVKPEKWHQDCNFHSQGKALEITNTDI